LNGKRFGYLLVGLVLLIEIPRFAATYSALDPMLFGLPLTAIGTGIVLPLGAGYVFHAWWATRKKHAGWLLAAFTALLMLEGAILIPWGMSRLQNESLTAVVGSGPLAWGWVSVVMLSPFVVVGAVVMAVAFQPAHKKYSEHSEQYSEQKRIEPKQKEQTPEWPLIDSTARAILETWRADPGLSMERVGQAVGVAKSTVARRKDEWNGWARPSVSPNPRWPGAKTNWKEWDS